MGEYLTSGEVAEDLRVDPETVRRWARSGQLRSIRLPSGGYRIPREELDKIKSTQGGVYA